MSKEGEEMQGGFDPMKEKLLLLSEVIDFNIVLFPLKCLSFSSWAFYSRCASIFLEKANFVADSSQIVTTIDPPSCGNESDRTVSSIFSRFCLC